ncbi:MAG: hypothetical protein M9934_05305 [Thermomicrobiales bacterium]|nr:hypothetical protein [Thermomicrobiales bacterium]
MGKTFTLVLALLLTLGLSVQSAAAQLDTDATELDPKDVPGLIAGYSRTYAPDIEALMATPSADLLDLSAYMRNVSIMTYVFESDDTASDFFDMMKDQMTDELSAPSPELGQAEMSEVTEIDRDAMQVTVDMGDLGVGLTILMFIDGDTVFAIMAMDTTVDDATAMAIDIANYLIDTEVQDDEVTFNEDGTSTGGVFDRMPASGDEIVGGLQVESDSDLFATAAE